jgi:hypothetical protein
MSNDDIKSYCMNENKNDPIKVLDCARNAVLTRYQEKCETVDGVIKCTKTVTGVKGGEAGNVVSGEIGVKGGEAGNVVSGEIGVKGGEAGNVVSGEIGVKGGDGEDKQKMMEAQKQIHDIFKNMRSIRQGYCPEGSVCGAPVYGRPLWIWVLAVFVILLALKAVDDC